MKTIEELKSELTSISITEVNGDEVEREKLLKVFKKNNTRAIFLKQCIMYLEKNPSESFIESEVTRLRHKLATIKLGYSGWMMPPSCKNAKTQYETDAGVPHIKSQIKTLTFLLN